MSRGLRQTIPKDAPPLSLLRSIPAIRKALISRTLPPTLCDLETKKVQLPETRPHVLLSDPQQIRYFQLGHSFEPVVENTLYNVLTKSWTMYQLPSLNTNLSRAYDSRKDQLYMKALCLSSMDFAIQALLPGRENSLLQADIVSNAYTVRRILTNDKWSCFATFTDGTLYLEGLKPWRGRNVNDYVQHFGLKECSVRHFHPFTGHYPIVKVRIGGIKMLLWGSTFLNRMPNVPNGNTIALKSWSKGTHDMIRPMFRHWYIYNRLMGIHDIGLGLYDKSYSLTDFTTIATGSLVDASNTDSDWLRNAISSGFVALSAIRNHCQDYVDSMAIRQRTGTSVIWRIDKDESGTLTFSKPDRRDQYYLRMILPLRATKERLGLIPKQEELSMPYFP